MTNNTGLDILRINEKITDIERRLNNAEKYLELIYKDRELLVEVQGSVAHLKSMMVSNQEHQNNTAKDIKADVNEVQFTVESAVAEVKDTVKESTSNLVTNIAKKENLIDKLKNKLFKKEGGEKNEIIKT